MTQLTINGRTVSVESGVSVLEAAYQLGITIPTLCHLKAEKPHTSCMMCVVKDLATGRLLPACSAPATEGMAVDTESEEVRQERKKVLDLLMSEHVGDCEAPCRTTCPARMDIPQMIRQIAAGRMKEAYETVTEMIALPAVLGRICPAPCEKACRRGRHDLPLSICALKRFVADVHVPELKVSADLAALRSQRGLPSLRSTSRAASESKKIAIIGAGPAGLAAAFHLARAGHACTVFDEHDQPGGQLRYRVSRDKLPLDVLDAEIEIIRQLGVEFRMKTRIEPGDGLQRLKEEYDAIVLTPGRKLGGPREEWPVDSDGRGVKVEANTYRTSDPVVFAGGEVVHVGQMSVRAVAHGKSIACAIDQWLGGRPVVGVAKPFESRLGQLRDGEIEILMAEADRGARVEPDGGFVLGYSAEEAIRESLRCLQCDCRKAKGCRLRELADEYGASQKTFTVGSRTDFTRNVSLRVIFEPGKCIKCGICVRITARSGSGMTFLGRGFNTVVGVPFGESLESALGPLAADCVRECPTGALAWKSDQ